MASYKIIDIEGIGEVNAKKLQEAGIRTTDAFLKTCATPKGRRDLAETTTISEKSILRWTNMTDLFRISGIGEEYSDLLEASGVDTVPELAQRNPENLHSQLFKINEEKNLVRALPNPSQVEKWVKEAKELPRVITY